MKEKNNLLSASTVMFLGFLAAISVWFSSCLFCRQAASVFSGEVPVSDSFRQMLLSEQTLDWLIDHKAAGGMTIGEILAVSYPFFGNGVCYRYENMDSEALLAWRRTLVRINGQGYRETLKAFSAIWDDVVCFPVTVSGVTFENTWMFERTYGGNRGHEGTDLIPPDNLSGIYSVVSMTDGIIEKLGWLEKGGYRIGVRSENGGYFYYAHLDSYAREFVVGDFVAAGEELGMMGDTGYGPEGTTGRFDVHLHLGIYIRTATAEEISVNPYWVLRYAQLLDA